MTRFGPWRLAGGALLACLALVVAGCTSGSSGGTGSGSAGDTGTTSGSGVNIWYVNPLPETPDWGRSGKLFTSAAAANGYRAKVVGPSKTDVSAMVNEMEQAMSDHADAIITCPTDPTAFKGVIKQAIDKGITVASVGCVDDDATFSVGTSNAAFGKQAADLVAQQTGGKANVGIISTDRTTPNQVAQVDAFKKQIAASHPGVQVKAWESDNSDASVAAQKINAMLTAYPDMNYIWMVEGAAAGAAPAALREANKKPGDVKVLAIDAQDSTLEGIKDGWITTTFNQCWFNTSPDIAKLIVRIKKDHVQPKKFYPVDIDPVSKSDLPYHGCPQQTIDQSFAS